MLNKTLLLATLLLAPLTSQASIKANYWESKLGNHKVTLHNKTDKFAVCEVRRRNFSMKEITLLPNEKKDVFISHPDDENWSCELFS